MIYMTNRGKAAFVGALLSLFLPLALMAQPVGSAAARLAQAIDPILSDPAFTNAWWGALVVNLEDGTVLYERHAGKNFVPASNTKLYTTAAALDQLGPDYRYRTEVYIDGPVVDGVVQGNLIVRGSGDPVIGGRFNDGDRLEAFRTWAKALQDLGITRIEGDLIGDDDVFDDTPLGYGWSWDDETYWYAAEISGLSFNDNNVDVAIRATRVGQPATITWEPLNTNYVQVINETTTTGTGTSIDEGYHRARGTNVIEISSAVPQNRTDTESLTVMNPTLFFVHVLRETLLQEGIGVVGHPVDVDDLSIKPDYDAKTVQEIAVHTSPPLTDIVHATNKHSQNLYAEQLLRTLASARPIDDEDLEPGSAAMGLAAAMTTFATAGVDTSAITLVDGSGLSHLNLVTPEMTAALLSYMWNHPDQTVRTAFYDSLPIGGQDGTLEYRFRDGPARGKVHAKTGTVSNVSTLSGYVPAGDGTPLAFVLMCNHHTLKSRIVRQAQDRVVNALARFKL
ncbi:MAG TPA: D-alanyl-D-alanine carboxypeptidase/D-alanyl-D-alanine-endopeptidase [Rhodothermales bacterium]|nr:D-alanyl-D-alanine carboxypeptidase/D-alanyl-D-alanine-endopeptidase [Rhodothermales bacterium]